jgi:hypothetical protein
LNRFPTKPFCRPTAFPRICRDMHSQAHFWSFPLKSEARKH